MTILHLDFETRSVADVKAVGLDNYARDPSTDVHCMAFAFDDNDVELWTPDSPKCVVYQVIEHIRAGGLVYAHNFAFEQAIMSHVMPRYGFRGISREQGRCTMAMAYAMGLPGSLDGVSGALGLEQGKDMKGHRVMLQLSKPRSIAEDGSPIWWDDPAKLQILYDYCRQDVEVERAVHKRLRELSPDEQQLYHLDQTINARGVRVDIPSIDAAVCLVTGEKARLDQGMRDVTGNVVAGYTDVAQLTAWLRFRGVPVPGVAKADVAAALSGKLPDDCRKALLLRQEAAKSSTAKLTAMRSRAGQDDRMRGLFQYHGASTGRWAGRGPQLHNMTRPTILHSQADIEDAIAHFDNARYLTVFHGDPMPLVADCMRGMVIAAPGHEFICSDYSNIEGRVLPWLAGEEWKIQVFRDYDAGVGADAYLLTVARGRGISIEASRPFRQEGKVEELAFQFGGGVGAMTTWCKTFGMVMSDEEKELRKKRWRQAHPAIVQYWRDLEHTAIRAVQDGGVQRVGKIAYVVNGSFLWCQLPSGRVLCYPFPQITTGKFGGPALTYMSVNSVTRKWERTSTYGGSLAENVTQAVARDILVAGIRNVEAAGYPVVMHVHDEIVAEVQINCGKTVDEMSTLMSNVPHWAASLPVSATGWCGRRYRKD